MGCCKSCDSGGPCEGCGGACGGKCDGRCKKKKHSHKHGHHHIRECHPYKPSFMRDCEDDGAFYQSVMGAETKKKIKEHVKVERQGDHFHVSYKLPGNKGTIKVTVPFAPIMVFCQNMAMKHGTKETTPNTVMGYAPIVSTVVAQLAANKIAQSQGQPPPYPNPIYSAIYSQAMPQGSAYQQYGYQQQYPQAYGNYAPINPIPSAQSMSAVPVNTPEPFGDQSTMVPGAPYGPASPVPIGPGSVPPPPPMAPYATTPQQQKQSQAVQITSDILRAIPFLAMMGISYEKPDDLSEVADVVMGLNCSGKMKNSPACRRHPKAMMGACGCGVPCDGIQQNSPYMNTNNVVRRAMPYTPYNAVYPNRFWRNAPVINDQYSNNFGRSKSPPPSATPPNGWPNRQINIIEPNQGQGGNQGGQGNQGQ